MNYSNFDDKRKDVVMSPEDDDQFIDTDKMQRKFGHKERSPIKSNGNISNKRGAVSFNIGRIMPRNMTQDKQFLYEQNIKLKQSIQQFRDQVTKLRTRLSATQKQKVKIVEEFNHSDGIAKNPSSRITGHRSGSMSYSNLQSQNYLKKMLRETKDQINLLKNENAKLKKTVKYTEIGELQVQNKYLIDQCSRLGRIIGSKVLDQNQYADSYERRIQQLEQELRHEKESQKSSNNQAKKKNQQIQGLKAEINELNLREKKLKKQLADYKKSSQTERKLDSSIKKFKHFDEKQCSKCRQLTKELELQKEKVKNMENELSSIKKSQRKSLKNGHAGTQKVEIKNSTLKVNTQNDQSNKTNGKVEKRKETEIKDEKSKDGYDDEFEDNEGQYDDKFENEEVVEQKGVKQGNRKNLEKQKDEYEQEFDEVDGNSDKQQILFEKKKQRPDHEVMKQTISYRLMSQRYTYNDLTEDIKESGMSEFTVQQLASMLNDQPFFLKQQQIQYILSSALGRQDLQLDQKIPTKQFLKKIRPFISDISLLSQQKEEAEMRSSIQKVRRKKKVLLKKWQEKSEDKTVTKEQFVGVLKEQKFRKEEIQLLLGEVSLVSEDIDRIDYCAFVDKLGQ